MNTLYIVALCGPVIFMFFMGIALLLRKNPVCDTVAVAAPTILAGIEAVIVMTVTSNGRFGAIGRELIPLLMVQVFMLAIVGLILFAIMLIAWQYDKPPKNIESEEYPLGEC